MANLISQVKLPNNTTYTIRDPNARPLSNNDFDTINVTELNAGDLIVTGVGRFTNGLYGNLSGTATQVSNNLKIQLNSGTTEGTNQFTYNGSSAKTVNITKSGIGLGNVENKSSATIRGELTSSNVTTALGYTPLNSNLKGASNGVAELDANGLVPSSQLPSYVDDVLEYSSKSAFPTTGETGKIYVATDTNLTYRWSGSAYTEISPSLALGETSSTAYRGDRGKTAYDHATDSSRLTTATASGLYKVASTAQGHIASLTAVTKADITGLGIPGANTDRYVNSAAFAHDSTNDNVKMTLTRAGSDTATVTANIPKVSSSSAGVVPKGATVSSQSQTTKFLREDGTWAAPSYTTSLAWGSVTGKPDSYTPSSHTHGNIQNGGTLQTTDITIASGDKLIVTDSSDSSKIARTSIAFDGSTATKALTQKGTWESFTNNSGTVTSVNATGATNTGISVTGGAITTSGTLTINLNLSDAINGLLTEGSSNAQRDDYIIAQYAGGGTTTKTYHRRKLSNIFAALNSSDITTALGYTPPTTDTKNTAGSTDTQSKIYLIGATSQAANPQTYSQDTAYVGTDGCVYSGGNKVEVVSNNAGYHNSVYRGKSLGTSITEAQWAAISAGTFEDMYIGDYWTLSTTLGSTTSNVQYVIAGFDYWWNCGDSYPQSSNKHHVVLVPAGNLYSAQMNATNITTGGYIGSAMYTTNLANARTGISTLFGDHLYSVRRLFTNSVNTVGQAMGWAWATSSVDLMSETMVYGHPVWTTSGFEVGVDRTILPLFALNPASASIRSNWWLRSVATPSYFALVNDYGYANCYSASISLGVRPAFAIY